MLKLRRPRRALSRAEVEQLLTREDISLRERTLWRMLSEFLAQPLATSPRCGSGWRPGPEPDRHPRPAARLLPEQTRNLQSG
jgi:hypothetical protein